MIAWHKVDDPHPLCALRRIRDIHALDEGALQRVAVAAAAYLLLVRWIDFRLATLRALQGRTIMADRTHDTKTLNSLLANVVDSIDGFEQANKLVDTASFKPIFFEVISERRKLAAEIEKNIRGAGGTPDDEGTMLASAHRVLMRLRDVISKGDTAVVDEAERGEDYIKAKFEKAAQDEQLSPDVAQFVASAAARVKAGHDLIRDLKHSLHAVK